MHARHRVPANELLREACPPVRGELKGAAALGPRPSQD